VAMKDVKLALQLAGKWAEQKESVKELPRVMKWESLWVALTAKHWAATMGTQTVDQKDGHWGN
jgi:hypothetical protein